MRPLHLKIAASVILSVGALFSIRQNESVSSVGNHSGDTREFGAVNRVSGLSRAHAGQKRKITSLDSEVRADSIADRSAEEDQLNSSDNLLDSIDEPDAVRNQTQERAVRLAPNVRLPAAIMAQGDHEPTPHRCSSASEAANQTIADRFYGELSSGSREPSNDSETDVRPKDRGELLVPTGLEVDRATQRANEAYRAMFGDAAYNRQSMMSAIEVNLPEQSVDSGN